MPVFDSSMPAVGTSNTALPGVNRDDRRDGPHTSRTSHGDRVLVGLLSLVLLALPGRSAAQLGGPVGGAAVQPTVQATPEPRVQALVPAPVLLAGDSLVPLAPLAAASDSVRPLPPPPPLESAFVQAQLRYPRVLGARLEARFAIKRMFAERGISYPASEIFLRVFKRERALEVWVRSPGMEQFALLKSYAICALAGELGPKRRQGDQQVPEGFYYIDHFNPVSDYYLSLHVDYPNRADALLGNSSDPGGDIFIHGGCNSIGCIAVTNEGIKEIYWLAVEARGVGQQRIPVHIFPSRLEDTDLRLLSDAFATRPATVSFWRNLAPGYAYFEQHRRIPHMAVNDRGEYVLAGEELTYEPLPRSPRGGPVPLGRPVDDVRRPPAPARGPVPLGRPVGR